MELDSKFTSNILVLVQALIFCLVWAYLWYQFGYQKGYTKGLTKNPERSEVNNYVYQNGQILRFAPGDRPILIDLEEGTVTTLFPREKKKSHESNQGATS